MNHKISLKFHIFISFAYQYETENIFQHILCTSSITTNALPLTAHTLSSRIGTRTIIFLYKRRQFINGPVRRIESESPIEIQPFAHFYIRGQWWCRGPPGSEECGARPPTHAGQWTLGHFDGRRSHQAPVFPVFPGTGV